jgi:hypothetical protein
MGGRLSPLADGLGRAGNRAVGRGEPRNEVDLTRTVNQDGTGTNPFHQPHYLLLNLAIGGTQGGDPAKTAFPARFEIDSVRVYQRTS